MTRKRICDEIVADVGLNSDVHFLVTKSANTEASIDPRTVPRPSCPLSAGFQLVARFN